MLTEQILKTQALGENAVVSFVKTMFFPKKPVLARPAESAPKPAGYTLAQKKELECLCARLFRKKSLVTSGKLQLIGLEKIRIRMGARWPALQAFVYSVADEVISRHTVQGDIYVRLKDDTYVIIFGEASYDQGELKAGLIAGEIQERLFSSGYEALREISVLRHVVETRTSDLASLSPAEALAVMTFTPAPKRPAPESPVPPQLSSKQEEPAAKVLPEKAVAGDASIPTSAPLLAVSYVPVWNHKLNALTSYLCQSATGAHMAPGVERDLNLLQSVAARLEVMAAGGQKFLIVCPVRHDTLYSQSGFERHAAICRQIPEKQRRLLQFMVTDVREELQRQNGFWFMAELRKLCRNVFLEIPLTSTPDFASLRRRGFEAVGVRIDPKQEELAVLGSLRNFRTLAAAAGIPKTFLLDVPTLSMTTAAVCMGFDCLCGHTIHAPVTSPDSIYRFQHEDLFTVKKADAT